jgi:diguanylate cyclase (GGDEF)-like protein/PAS domain S-box-containing protein
VNVVLQRVLNSLPWRVSPTAAWDEDYHAALSRTLASILFVVSGLVQCLILLFPTHPDMNRPGLLTVGLFNMTIGLIIERLPVAYFKHRLCMLTLVPTAIFMVGMHNYFISNGPTQYSIFFIVCFVWLGVARSRGTSVRTVPILIVAYLAPMMAHHNASPANIATTIYVVTVCVLVGEMLAWMVVRLRASEAELERRKVSEELDRAESRYQALIEQLPSVTYIYKEHLTDPAKARDEYISPQIVNLLGVTQEEWMSESLIWERFIHPDDRTQYHEAAAAVFPIGDPFDHEYRMIRPDGRIIWILETARRVDTSSPDEVTWLGEYYDITKIREAEANLTETSTRYRTMLEQVPLAIYLEHVNTGSESVPCFYVSPQIAGLTGYTPAEWLEPRRWEQTLHPEDRDRVRNRWAEATRQRGQFLADYRLIAQDGRTVWIHDEAVLVFDEQGEPKYWHGFMLDITREKEAEVQLRQSEAEFRLLFSRNPLPAWVYDRETLAILEVNERAIEHYGYTREEFMDLVVTDLIHPGLEPHGREIAAGHAVQRHLVRSGRLIEVEITAHPLTFRDRPATLVIAQDVTARLAMQAQLSQQAFHDALTGLPNRVLFRERLSRALKKSPDAAVIFIDLDDFKRINDSLGHSAGDAVLIAVAGRLATCVRAGDTIARLGGDEFTILLNGCSMAEALQVVERIHAALHEPLSVDGREMVISPSIGIALGDEETSLPEELLRRADVAMYVAKRTGKSRHVVFSADMDAHSVLRLDLEADLRRAIQRDELELHFQPITEVIGGELVALEVLVRWNHPAQGQIPPATFIPVAEESGLIVALGTWVLQTACRQVAAWQRERPDQEPITVSVNISARQFQDQRLIAVVQRAIEDSGIEPRQIMLEITESVALSDLTDTQATLRALSQLGVHLAIDDFGTGYSGLSYLQRCRIETIKIDQSYIHGICVNPGDEAMVRAVSAYAATLGVDVVAEGVETEAQLAKLREIGIRMAQGYLFSPPLPAETIESRYLSPILKTA